MRHPNNHLSKAIRLALKPVLLLAVAWSAAVLWSGEAAASEPGLEGSFSESFTMRPDTLAGRPDSTGAADSSAAGQSASDTTLAAPGDTTAAADSARAMPDSLRRGQREQKKKIDTLHIWKRGRAPATDTLATDSLMRWEYWHDLSQRQAREPGVFSYSMGTSARWNALQIDNFQPDEMRLYWDHIPMRDPLTGNVPWFSVPHHHIDKAVSSRIGPEYEARLTSPLFYRLKPQTRFSYDEGREGIRNMDFLLTQNVHRRHNILIDYWDRQGGNEYPRSTVDGRQIYASTAHHLGQKYLLRSGFLQNAMTIYESFGYEIGDPLAYNFYAPATAASQRSASSDWNRKSVYLQLFKRPDSLSRERAGVSLFGMDQQRSLEGALDTTQYQIKRLGSNAFVRRRMGPLFMEGRFEASLFSNRSKDYMDALDTWTKIGAGLDLEFRPASKLTIKGSGRYRYRSDYQSLEPAGHLGGTVEYGGEERLSLGVGAGLANRHPKLQALYHNEAGDTGLDTEKQAYLEAFGHWRINDWWSLRARGRYTARDGAVGLPNDSTYVNLSPFQDYSAWVSSEIDLPHWEISVTAQSQFSETSRQDSYLDALTIGDPKVWGKGKVFWKNYVLGQAAYVKLGFTGTGSPNYYLLPSYQPHLNDWSLTAESAYNPPFYRVDAEMHARVRSLMIHLRWVNVMDQVGQLGYFQSWPYPMPGRRFMFGLRVIFNN